jgi:hypothetical protein
MVPFDDEELLTGVEELVELPLLDELVWLLTSGPTGTMGPVKTLALPGWGIDDLGTWLHS